MIEDGVLPATAKSIRKWPGTPTLTGGGRSGNEHSPDGTHGTEKAGTGGEAATKDLQQSGGCGFEARGY